MTAPSTGGGHSVDVVQDLRDKLRAAQNRERDLHKHLLFHLQGVDARTSYGLLLRIVPLFETHV